MESINDLLKRYKDSKKDIILEGADFISQKGYTLIPNFVLYTEKLSTYAKLVYSMLLSYAWNKSAVFPGQNTLAKDCGMGIATVKRTIKELKDKKFVTVIQRGLGKTNIYILHFKKK